MKNHNINHYRTEMPRKNKPGIVSNIYSDAVLKICVGTLSCCWLYIDSWLCGLSRFETITFYFYYSYFIIKSIQKSLHKRVNIQVSTRKGVFLLLSISVLIILFTSIYLNIKYRKLSNREKIQTGKCA